MHPPAWERNSAASWPIAATLSSRWPAAASAWRSWPNELAGRAQVHPVEADLNTVEGVARAMEALRQKGPVDYLVNNAGFGTFGFFPDLGIEGQRDMVSLHIDASITLCRAAIPFMRERGRGHIINVSSVGAFLPSPGIAVYGATKAFLNFFSLALQAELDGHRGRGAGAVPRLHPHRVSPGPRESWLQ